jgi:hypothetical protein
MGEVKERRRGSRGLKRVPATGLARARSSDPGIGFIKKTYTSSRGKKQQAKQWVFWPWSVFSYLARVGRVAKRTAPVESPVTRIRPVKALLVLVARILDRTGLYGDAGVGTYHRRKPTGMMP